MDFKVQTRFEHLTTIITIKHFDVHARLVAGLHPPVVLEGGNT